MSASVARGQVTTKASRGDASDKNFFEYSHCANVVHKGDNNQTHVGHNNRDNQGVIVTGGSAIFNAPRESNEILNGLRRAPAYYDSSLRKQAQECMPETRVAVLNTIYEWVDNHNAENPPIFWLHGPAGTGKSTIAHSVAVECRKRRRLGASFFFAHANAECGDADLFFSTIAYQLSKFDPDLQQYIIDGVRAHPSPADASIPTQFEEFILTPLRKLSNDPTREPIIVVVDAFDECSDAEKASEILQLLSVKILGLPLRLKLFLTSRPEPEIRLILHPDIDGTSRSFDLVRDVDASSTDGDIRCYLRFHLNRIGKEYELPVWPREMDVAVLAQQVEGLFIFAHTGVEFIRDKSVSDPESQLTALKNIGFNATPAFNLNELYSRILRKAMPDAASTAVQERIITIVHTIVGLRAPLAMCAIGRLLGFDRRVIRTVLNTLRSIFIVPENDEDTVQVIHPSFSQYITNEETCTEQKFHVGRRQLHSHMAKLCLKQMKNQLKQNICDFKDFVTVEAPIKDEAGSDVLQTISEDVKYSCQNFAAHVYSADWQDGELYEMVAEWTNRYLLYWLEVLALVDLFFDALPSLRMLSSFYEKQPSYLMSQKGFLQFLPIWPKAPPVPQLLTDAIRMVSESYDDIKRFPHQIYASCLAFCPLDSTLFQQYSRLSTVRVLHGERKNWRPLLYAFKDPDGRVVSLTFSPDGTILASCSSGGKILLWNLKTGESRLLTHHTLRCHTAFTFSPNGKYIAADGNLYRVATGEKVLAPGSCLALSPDSGYVALGCANGIIRLLDMQATSLSLLGELFGHEDMITTLAFSSDSRYLASASSDNICVWNSHSRELIRQVPCRGSYGSMTFSFDGNYVAAHYEPYLTRERFATYLCVVDIQTGREHSISIEMLDNVRHPNQLTSIFSPNGNYTASRNYNTIYVVKWLAATQAPSPLLSRDFGSGISSIFFTPDEKSLLVGNEQGLIRSWRIPIDGRSMRRFDFECKAHFWTVQAITLSHNGKYLASASVDGSICVWDSTSVDLHEPDLSSAYVKYGQTVVFAPNGETLAVGSGNTLTKIDAMTGHGRPIFHRPNGLHWTSHSLIFSTDGKYLASNSCQELLLWDMGRLRTLFRWRKPWETKYRILAQALSPDVIHHAIRFSNGDLWIYDLRSGEGQRVEHTNKEVCVDRLRFSPDSKYLVSCRGVIRVYDIEKGVEADLNLPLRKAVFDCAFSPRDGNVVYTHRNGLDVLENLAKNPKVREIRPQYGYWSVEFSPDAKYILAVPDSHYGECQLDLYRSDTLEMVYAVKLWRKCVDQAMREFRKTGRLLNHPSFQLLGYEDFPYLLDRDGWVITASSKRLCRLPVAHRGEVYDVNGNRIVAISPEGKLTLIQFGPNAICAPILS